MNKELSIFTVMYIPLLRDLVQSFLHMSPSQIAVYRQAHKEKFLRAIGGDWRVFNIHPLCVSCRWKQFFINTWRWTVELPPRELVKNRRMVAKKLYRQFGRHFRKLIHEFSVHMEPCEHN